MEQQLSSGNGPIDGYSRNPSTALDRWVLERIMHFVGNPRITLELWDGWHVGDARASRAKLRILDRVALVKLIVDPEFMFGELYTDGRIEVDGELLTLLEEVYRGLAAVGGTRGVLQRGLEWVLAPTASTDSPAKSKRNARAHYDLGNEFYSMWLDHDYMQYTCAYYPTPDTTLERAQQAKLDLVCRKLNLKPGEQVVEAGGGWGGLARYMAQHYGVTVTSYNVSHEQVEYARDQAQRAGLSARVSYVEDDYRNISGCFDAFVSVGMLEHVGIDNLAVLGSTIDSCLSSQGRGLLHSIGQVKPRPLNKWIEANIFPGAEPPSLSQMTRIFEPQDLVINDVENLRSHYALTLKAWSERFAANEAVVGEMFDEAFVRMWRLYLAGSTAAFTVGSMQLLQVVFSRAQSQAIPMTRNHLFDGGPCAPA